MAKINVPDSDNTVRLRAIDAQTKMSVSAKGFVQPALTGHENLNLTSVTFLIEHAELDKRVLFDCGARKDFENFSPRIKERLNLNVRGLKIEKDVHEVVEEAGIKLEELDSMIWSHWHWVRKTRYKILLLIKVTILYKHLLKGILTVQSTLKETVPYLAPFHYLNEYANTVPQPKDHHGAPEKYPPSVEIVVGPGFREHFIPAYPTVPDAIFLDANFANRTVREVFFDDAFKIGNFRAHDFFGDGSFYLLDTPGHAIGHMCGLARTTPSTFVMLGGDICHFGGSFRPSPSIPLPDPVPSSHLDAHLPIPCPCSVFTDIHPAGSDSDLAKTTPFFEVTSSPQSAYLDRAEATSSIRELQKFDQDPNILVCIAHDPTLLNVLPFLNYEPDKDLNDWQEKQLKEKAQWGWLNELPRGGKPGRPMLVEGVWKEGELIKDFTKLAASIY